MKITLIAPSLPPKLDGIGDYSALLSAELARRNHAVTILTALVSPTPITGVALQTVFDTGVIQSVQNIVAPIVADPPDWVLVQYNPFSYGKWGWNPHLVPALQQVRKACPQTRIAVMAHETFVPAESAKFVVMTAWQRMLFWRLGQTVDLLFLSVEAWANQFQKWFPRIPVRHLPVGANIPRLMINNTQARQEAGVPDDAFVVGLFGTAHPSRMFSRVAHALNVLKEKEPRTGLLYVGPHGSVVQEAVQNIVPVYDAGALSPDAVSRHFSAMDMCLTPYLDGVSTRRGAFMAGLQHGVPSVGTTGIHTDSILKASDGTAFFLPPVDDETQFYADCVRLLQNPALRRDMGRAARTLYDTSFDWPPVAQAMLSEMEAAARPAN